MVHAKIFCREKNSAFSTIVDSRRIVPTHAAGRRSQQLVSCYLFLLFRKSNYLQNLTTVGIELKDKR